MANNGAVNRKRLCTVISREIERKIYDAWWLENVLGRWEIHQKVGYKPGHEIICVAWIGHWILKDI